ncbi:30S ribosomal protein S20 [Candidatus Saccharibacteria bacterium]|nr:30S ribosomal protein S20 [Candidatus Saccharibacteria bacterium]MBP9132180.1 30S ribosomal protein S20 [Candidatus Saccharibacteria bacterium]
MPIIKSAKKRVRQAEKRLARNRIEKRALRECLKTFNASLEAKKPADIEEAKKELQSQIDKMVKKNILHKNTAARRKSAISAKAKAAGAKVTKSAPKTATKAKPAATKPKSAAKTPAKKAPAKAKTPAKKPAAKKTDK